MSANEETGVGIQVLWAGPETEELSIDVTGKGGVNTVVTSLWREEDQESITLAVLFPSTVASTAEDVRNWATTLVEAYTAIAENAEELVADIAPVEGSRDSTN